MDTDPELNTQTQYTITYTLDPEQTVDPETECHLQDIKDIKFTAYIVEESCDQHDEFKPGTTIVTTAALAPQTIITEPIISEPITTATIAEPITATLELVSENSEPYELCLLCAKPVRPGLVIAESGDLLKLLCKTMDFPTIEPLLKELNLPVEKSQFCEDCAKTIVDTADILIQMKMLQESLEKLRKQLKTTIKASLKDNSNVAYSGVEERAVGPVIRKLLAQCWSECSVDVVRVEDTPKTGRKKVRATKRKRQSGQSKANAPKIKIAMGKLASAIVTRKKSAVEKENTLADSDQALRVMPKKRQRKTNPLVDKLLKASAEGEDVNADQDDTSADPDFFEGGDYLDEAGQDAQEDVTETLKKRRSEKRKMKPSVIAEFKKRNESKPFRCDECGKGYGSQKFFEAHVKTHSGELPFQCEHCDKRFSLRTYLLNHNRVTHNIANRLNNGSSKHCIYCGVDFFLLNPPQPESGESIQKDQSAEADPLSVPHSENPEADSLNWAEEKKRRDHMRKCPENPRIKYKSIPSSSKIPCDQCSKTFVTLHALRCHIVAIHHKGFKLYCEVCGAGFLIPAALKRHLETVHTNEKKWECDHCDQKFKTRFQLIYHRRRHTGQLPFTCEICGKSFPTSDKLRLHSYVHLEEKRFACPICGKMFKSTHYVNNHIYSTHKRARKSRTSKKAPAIVNVKAEIDPDIILNPENVDHIVETVETMDNTEIITEPVTVTIEIAESGTVEFGDSGLYFAC